MRLPYADELPASVRRIGQALLAEEKRHAIAAALEHVAHLQYATSPRFFRSRRMLAAARNRHRGETCVILGNGPSLKGQDLSCLAFARTFCLNRGYLMWREQGLTPDYYVAVNDLVLEQFNCEIAELDCPLFLPWRHHQRFKSCDRAIFVEVRWKQKFFTDVTLGLWPGATVTAAALQIAYHMGFAKVILLGIDHRFALEGPAHEEVVQQGDDMSHFAPDYFGKGVRWNLPDLEQSEHAYRLARAAYEADGRLIIDSTPGGRCEVFVKMPLAEAETSIPPATVPRT